MRNKLNFFINFVILLLVVFASAGPLFSQPLSDDRIGILVQEFKKDPRGPYQAIRWFCIDGTVNPAYKPCPQPGGIQHALPKDIVRVIEKEKGIYLGQILAGTSFEEFFDHSRQNSRLKQYQMEKYLQAVDDGWVLRRARYYRGAIQDENESSWGQGFLSWLLSMDDEVRSRFFLVRQAVRNIPHRSEAGRWKKIRALSKNISDSFPSFMELRIKIHGQPEQDDLARVRDFHAMNRDGIDQETDGMFRELEKELSAAYQTVQTSSLKKYMDLVPGELIIHRRLGSLIEEYGGPGEEPEKEPSRQGSMCNGLADLLWDIRKELLSTSKKKARLAVMDLSNEIEEILFREVQSWRPGTLRELLEKGYVLAKAASGCGFLEIWEWEAIEPVILPGDDETLTAEKFMEKVRVTQRLMEWGNGTVAAIYDPVSRLFRGFEHKADTFQDDLIRSSILLPLGRVAGQLMEISSEISTNPNHVMGIPDQNQVRGLNPGVATGELEVIEDGYENTSFSSRKIYVMSRVPSELRPVAGIATVSEGNLVSHVQLLARNLGIPNAIITRRNLEDLIPFSGERVFYAVSPGGTVIMKPESKMTHEEMGLLGGEKRSSDKIMVPTGRLDLKKGDDLISLKGVRVSDSGRLCGPKAANLGELKHLFPEKVVNGLIIPFGVFRAHLDQVMPGTRSTFWQYLQETFIAAGKYGEGGGQEEEIESHTLERLGKLRSNIKDMPFLPGFHEAFRKRFEEEFGSKAGTIPVFIRSDTNMEDLKEFTGAGLNLTLFNVVQEEKIFQGIRDVWSSPYTERSYLWRQKYLLNPENVFPSILIIPAVNVDKSGVMITAGIPTSDQDDITVAFNRGAGGAVEGQTAESYLLRGDGAELLLSPSRELSYTALPPSGGTEKVSTGLADPILTSKDLKMLREFAAEVRKKLPETGGIGASGPLDIELGFEDNRIWLFQVRPYVENRKAASSAYLRNLDPEIPEDKWISLSRRIEGIE